MYIRYFALALLLTTALGFPAYAFDDGQPTLAFLSYRHSIGSDLGRKGFLDMMEAYGFIDEDERAVLNNAEDLDGDKINVFWGDAGGDLPTVNLLVEKALDRGATVLVTLSTPVSHIAANITSDMEDPVPVVFSIVSAPYLAGIAEAPCIKPDHVAGTILDYPRDLIVSLVPLQNPGADAIGVLVNAAEANSVKAAQKLTFYGEALGLKVEAGPIASAADLPVALEALLDKGVDAVFTTGYVDTLGLAAIVGPALDAGVPIISPAPLLVKNGAPIGAGFYSFYREGVIAGRIIANYLKGDVDLSTLAINAIPEVTVALNLDIAAEYGFEFSDALLERADFVFQNGASTEDSTPPELPDLSYEQLRAADLEFLAGLKCTPEMVAAQQAALDAAGD